MKKKSENYLEHVPMPKEGILWSEEDGLVTIQVENRGFFNRLFQLVLKKPKYSFIHLDEMGSFLWKRLDGKQKIMDLGPSFEEAFGEKAQPLYPRLAKYMQILESYGFITFTEEKR